MKYGMPGWKALGYKTYLNYLLSDAWKDKRDLMIKLKKKCEMCGETKDLQVHHLNYLNVGNEGQDDLIVLCRDCHNKLHEKENDTKKG